MARLRADPGSHSDEAGTEGSHLTTPCSTPAAAQLILQAQLTSSRVRPWRGGVKVGVWGQHICLETFSGQVGGNGFLSGCGGHRQAQAFLCSGGRYSRPRCLKMSSSEVTWKNVFCSGSNSPWLFSHRPFSFRLKRRSSRWKSFGEGTVLSRAGPAPPPGGPATHCLPWSQSSRAGRKGTG